MKGAKGAGRAAGPAAEPPRRAEPACFGEAETACGPGLRLAGGCTVGFWRVAVCVFCTYICAVDRRFSPKFPLCLLFPSITDIILLYSWCIGAVFFGGNPHARHKAAGTFLFPAGVLRGFGGVRAQ